MHRCLREGKKLENAMNEVISYRQVEEKVLSLRGQDVILDRDVAELYGVGTKEINQAAKNNPAKFPEGYIFTLDNREKANWSKILTGSTRLNFYSYAIRFH
jgi:hypothetical protein